MVESFQTESFEERKSQNLGFGDFVKGRLLWVSLPFTLGGAALLVGRLTKHRMFPLDGTPMITTKIYDTLVKKGFGKLTGEKLEINEVDRLSFITRWFADPKDQVQAAKHTWNFLKGFEVGAIPAIYMLWRNKEEKKLDLVPAYDRLKKLNELKPSDEELAAENASLKQQLAFVQSREAPSTEASPVLHLADASHEGRVADGPARERAV